MVRKQHSKGRKLTSFFSMQFRKVLQVISGIGPSDVYLGKSTICNWIYKQHVKHISGSRKHSVLHKLCLNQRVWERHLHDDENGSQTITSNSPFMLHTLKLKQKNVPYALKLHIRQKSHPKFKPIYNTNFILLLEPLLTTLHCKTLQQFLCCVVMQDNYLQMAKQLQIMKFSRFKIWLSETAFRNSLNSSSTQAHRNIYQSIC